MGIVSARIKFLKNGVYSASLRERDILKAILWFIVPLGSRESPPGLNLRE